MKNASQKKEGLKSFKARKQKNYVENGGMTVANFGVEFINVAATNRETLDGFIIKCNGRNEGSLNVYQESKIVPRGFSHSLRVDVASKEKKWGEQFRQSIRYEIENPIVVELGFGSHTKEQFTISFYARSSVPGIYCVSVGSLKTGRICHKEYKIADANVYQRYSLTFDVDTSQSWKTTESPDFEIQFVLSCGENLISKGLDKWEDGEAVSSPKQMKWGEIAKASYFLTGVQLERGARATRFIDIKEDSTKLSSIQSVSTFMKGALQYKLWCQLAHHDIAMRYKGSTLGPFWITLSTLTMIATAGVLFGKIFNQNIYDYLPMFTVGLVFWYFIASTITEGSNTFISYASVLQSSSLPYSTFILRVVYRNILTLLHNAIIIPCVLIFCGSTISAKIFILLPALLIAMLTAFWVTTLFAILSAKFRDVPQILTNIVTISFLLTPIFWDPAMLGRYKNWVNLNPFYSFIDILRSPILDKYPNTESWIIVLFINLVGIAVTYICYISFNKKIKFWLN